MTSFAKYQINYIIRPNLEFSSLISYACFVTNDVKFQEGNFYVCKFHIGVFHEDILSFVSTRFSIRNVSEQLIKLIISCLKMVFSEHYLF